MREVINKSLADKRFRYVVTGGVSFLAEYGSFLLMIYLLSVPAWLSQAISYCIGLTVNFLLLRYWAFQEQNKDRTRTHLYKFGLLVAFNLPLTTLVLNFLVKEGVAAFVAKVVVVMLAALWNYLIYDKLIFKEHLSPEDVL